MPKLAYEETKAGIQEALTAANAEIERLKAQITGNERERANLVLESNQRLADANREKAMVQSRLDEASRRLEAANAQISELRAKSLPETLAWGFSRQVLEPGLQDDARGVFDLLAKAYAGRRKSSFSTGVESGDKATGKVESSALGRKLQLKLELGSSIYSLALEEAPRYESLKYERMYGMRNETDWLSNSKPKENSFINTRRSSRAWAVTLPPALIEELVGDLPSRSEIAAFMPATTMLVHGNSLGRFLLYRGRFVLTETLDGVPATVADLIRQLFAELDKQV